MLEGQYGAMNRYHALKTILRPADFPDVALAVGFAEYLGPVSNNLKVGPKVNTSVIQEKLTDDAALQRTTNAGKVYTVADFPQGHYLGEAIY